MLISIFYIFIALALFFLTFGLLYYDKDLTLGSGMLGIAGTVFIALSFASWNIEFPHVFAVYNASSNAVEVISYTYTDYTEAGSWLFLGLGIICYAVSFVSVLIAWRGGER